MFVDATTKLILKCSKFIADFIYGFCIYIPSVSQTVVFLNVFGSLYKTLCRITVMLMPKCHFYVCQRQFEKGDIFTFKKYNLIGK